MIKVMIVEDEERIRHILKIMIEKLEEYEVVAEADSFANALTAFSIYRPDVIFVDVDLNGDSGLECAKVMVNLNPKLKVIFATAHSEYMANAFEIYAFDYLVKPFNMERVHQTLQRIKDSMSEKSQLDEVKPQSIEVNRDKLMIKGKEHTLFIDKKEIVMVERSESATMILTEDETYRSNVSLTDLEAMLTGEFIRSHKSYIINIGRISKIEPYGRWTYVVKFKGFSETALITAQKYEELKTRFLQA